LSGVNVINAGDGNNELSTGDGDDLITAGSGNDRIRAGAGTNQIDAGGGDNSIVSLGNDTIATGGGSDRFTLAAGAGVATILNFDQRDRFILGSLSFNDLAITQVGANAQIAIAASNDPLAILQGTLAGTIESRFFLST
jgi:3-phytase